MARVVVLDDDPVIGAAVAQALEERAGARVRVFDDPIQALEALAQERADLLITDLSMPWMDGDSVVASARRAQPDLDVIVMSAYGRGARVAQARGARFLRKPIDVRALVEAVGAAERRRQEHARRLSASPRE
jgi:DNA-binding NtrC family response regulator